MARPHIEPYVELNDGYQPFNLPGFPSGSHFKMLSMDEDTGACSMKMQFEPGYKREPGMSYSDSELFVLEGRVSLGGQVYGSSDTDGAKPASDSCTPADFHATVYTALGISPRTEQHDQLGRPYQICSGNPLPLF